MFKSAICKKYNSEIYLYEIEDSYFAIICGVPDNPDMISSKSIFDDLSILITRAYHNRGLDVAKNLALFVIWFAERNNSTTHHLCELQDDYCPKHIPNWKEYATSRNEWLEKIQLLK